MPLLSMRKIKNTNAQKLLDGICHLTGHRLFPQKDACERCRRPIVYYSISINNVYIKTEAQIFKFPNKILLNLNVTKGDIVEITGLTRKGLKYHKFHKKLSIRKPRRALFFKF